jgi:3-oxoacyl-[acyl-carrier protein] reductase
MFGFKLALINPRSLAPAVRLRYRQHMTVPLSLEGKVALITGGSRGIGAAAVRLFRQAGARVAFNYRSAASAAHALSAELGGPKACLAIEQELASPQQGRELVAETLRAFGRLDALVVNHGVWTAAAAPFAVPPDPATPDPVMTDRQWRHTLAVNLDSAFGLAQTAAAHMLSRAGASTLAGASASAGNPGSASASPESPGSAGHPDGSAGHEAAGYIVFVSSTAGQRGEANHADYAASKGALISLTKSLSGELAPHRILVNCVAPGWVDTEMSAPALADPASRAKIFSAIPQGRVARPMEIAGPILFLCTPFAGFMSGEIVNVNGGAVLVG